MVVLQQAVVAGQGWARTVTSRVFRCAGSGTPSGGAPRAGARAPGVPRWMRHAARERFVDGDGQFARPVAVEQVGERARGAPERLTALGGLGEQRLAGGHGRRQAVGGAVALGRVFVRDERPEVRGTPICWRRS